LLLPGRRSAIVLFLLLLVVLSGLLAFAGVTGPISDRLVDSIGWSSGNLSRKFSSPTPHRIDDRLQTLAIS
jgi:hypothetical protein